MLVDSQRLQHFQQRLEDQRTELTDRLDKLKADATSSHSADSSEQAQERENDEVIDALGNETRETIRQINAALLRIQEGEYGTCVNCGNTINPARLEIKPEASLCIQCAD
ncbi:MAG: TraR/DksA C4-type zinc finger protein [Cellvibrionaceae bacterium]